MGNNTGHDWLRSLDEIEHAIGGCLAALDTRESRVAGTFTDAGRSVRDLMRGLESQSHTSGWVQRLTAANSHVEQADGVVAELKVDWDRWVRALTVWQRSVEQLPGAGADGRAVLEAIAHVTDRGHHPGGG